MKLVLLGESKTLILFFHLLASVLWFKCFTRWFLLVSKRLSLFFSLYLNRRNPNKVVAGSSFIALTIDRSPPQGLFITGDVLATPLFRTGEFKGRQMCVFELLKVLDAEWRGEWKQRRGRLNLQLAWVAFPSEAFVFKGKTISRMLVRVRFDLSLLLCFWLLSVFDYC